MANVGLSAFAYSYDLQSLPESGPQFHACVWWQITDDKLAQRVAAVAGVRFEPQQGSDKRSFHTGDRGPDMSDFLHESLGSFVA